MWDCCPLGGGQGMPSAPEGTSRCQQLGKAMGSRSTLKTTQHGAVGAAALTAPHTSA